MTDGMGGTCVATECGKPARGHFCETCWGLLPWAIRQAITSARKTGDKRKETVVKARQYLEQIDEHVTGNK